MDEAGCLSYSLSILFIALFLEKLDTHEAYCTFTEILVTSSHDMNIPKCETKRKWQCSVLTLNWNVADEKLIIIALVPLPVIMCWVYIHTRKKIIRFANYSYAKAIC